MDDLDKIQQELLQIKQNQTNDNLPMNPAQPQPASPLVGAVTAPTTFSKAVDEAKVKVIQEASANDEKFVKEVTHQLKEAVLKAAQVEKEKQVLEEQNILYSQELLETKQKLNEYEQKLTEWERKTKKRQYHYEGVKPIMESVGIKSPLNLFLLYFLTFILVWFFLIRKLFQGTIGALIAGAEDENRSKAVKGFLWTLLGLVVFAVVVVIVGAGIAFVYPLLMNLI